jgi:hypothetical protein
MQAVRTCSEELSARAKERFKRDREDDDDPVVQPEVEPYTREGCTAQSVVKGIVTGPMLTVEIEGGGDRHTFVVDTGAMVSIIQPGISKAQMQPGDVKDRGVTGTVGYIERTRCRIHFEE